MTDQLWEAGLFVSINYNLPPEINHFQRHCSHCNWFVVFYELIIIKIHYCKQS